MELIKDIIKVDNRIDFGKFQTFIETEAVVPVLRFFPSVQLPAAWQMPTRKQWFFSKAWHQKPAISSQAEELVLFSVYR